MQPASFQDKLNEAVRLAEQLAHPEPEQAKASSFCTREELDLIWNYADGLYSKYYLDHINGKTSLKNMLNFDMAKEEKKLEQRIKTLKTLSLRVKEEI